MLSRPTPLVNEPNYGSEIRPLLRDWGKNLRDSVLNQRYLNLLATIKEQLSVKLPPGDIWLQTIDNLVAMDTEIKYMGVKGKYWPYMNARDTQMAANVKWLTTQRFPREKIIVWAHNYHVSKYGGHFEGHEGMNPARTIGTVFTTDPLMAAQTYIIGFSSYEGTSGRLFPAGHDYILPTPAKDGFENWIPAHLDYAFVDFQAFNKNNPGADRNFNLAGGIINGGINGSWMHKDTKAPWNKVFDGVFFIRKMVPSKLARAIPPRQTVQGTN